MRVRGRRLLRAALVAAAVLGLWACVPVARVELDEGGVPTNRQAHLPRAVDVVGEDEFCGSGGCWRVLVLTWPEHTSDELAQRLGLTPGGTGETCRAVSLLDRRRACLAVGPVMDPPAGPGLLKVQLRWNRPLGL